MSARAYPILVPHRPTRPACADFPRPSELPAILVSLDLPGGLVLMVARRGPADCHHTQQNLDTAAPTYPPMREIVSLALYLAAGAFHVDVAEIRGYSRAVPIVTARHTAWWLLRNCGWTLAWIGGQFGRDHGTILHGLRSLSARIETESALRTTLEKLRSQFNANITRG